MTFRNAQKLHREDKVVVKITGKTLHVVSSYVFDDQAFSKAVFVRCDDGRTYHHQDICQ